jgi:hypothetical protein
MTAVSTSPEPYPVQLSIDYADGPRDRVTALFRAVLALPIVILYSTLTDSGFAAGGREAADGFAFSAKVGGLLFVPTLLMLVFRRKYPGWWFDWNLNLSRFGNRVAAYCFLLRDEYPSTDEEQAVHLTLPDPGGGAGLNRWLPLVKWVLVIPHFIVLIVLAVLGIVVLVIGWVAIVLTGRLPRWVHDYVVGILRWGLRVEAYAFALVTDRYPPFRLAA